MMRRLRLRGRHPERIDPFRVGEPWRHFVQGALQAQARYDRAVGGLPSGPLRERLREIGRRIEEACQECWRIAQRGEVLDDAVSTLDVAAVRQRLAARTGDTVVGTPVDDPVVASLLAQLAAAERLTAVVSEARERLGLLEAHLDEAVATAVALSTLAGDPPDPDRVRRDVDLVVEDLAALSVALDESKVLGA